MKILKKIGKVLLWTLVVVVVLLLASPLWLGPAAKSVANSVVPGIIGTDFKLGRLSINQYTGALSVGDLKIANPEGYSKENCVELGSLDVNVAMSSLMSDKIRIEEIVVDGLYIATTLGGGNFTKIADNASGGEEAAKDEEGGKKVQIDKLVLKNLKLKYGAVPVPLPTLTLEGIGADKPEGATWEDAWNAIQGAVMKSANAVADLGKAAAGVAVDAAGAAVDAAGKVGGAAIDAAGAAAGAVGDAVSGAAGAVGDAAGKAVDAVKGIFK